MCGLVPTKRQGRHWFLSGFDSEMRAFEGPGEAAEWTLTAYAGPSEDPPESRPTPLAFDDVKYRVSYEFNEVNIGSMPAICDADRH